MIRALCLCLFYLSAQAAVTMDPFAENNFNISYEAPFLDVQAEKVMASKIIKAIAQEAQQNIVLVDALESEIDLQWVHIHWEKALTLLCAQAGCKVERNEDAWVVRKSATLDDKQLRVFPLYYIKAASLIEVIKQSHDWFADKSFVSVDLSSNALVAHASAAAMRVIEALVKTLDKPAQQVMIEARIINANETFAKELGVAFSAMQKNATVAGPEGSFGHFNMGVARLPLDTQLDVMISAAQKNHQTRVLAMPKILTANEQEAHIKQGKELAFQETSASGATSVKFKEAVLELRVTPHISLNQEIMLDLTVKHDVPGKLADNGQPTIDTQSIQTQVRMKDGETIVLGGIFSQTNASREAKVPVLHKIPLLGVLFKERSDRDDREELLVFVTPHLL